SKSVLKHDLPLECPLFNQTWYRFIVSSGIGTVDCARHNMKRPSGVGDLQKGERYLNMDYLFFMSLRHSPLTHLYVSHDIACQWHKNIWERMKVFSSYEGVEFVDGEKLVVFLVPKFHLPAHIEACNILFSFNLTPFVGRTDGEAPERGWADANRLANSTSISGPGARRDALDVHFQSWNRKKIVALGRVLLERLQKNVPLMLETRAAWVDVETSYPSTIIEEWTVMAVQQNNLKDVRRRLADVAAADMDHFRVRGDMHDTEMLSMGSSWKSSSQLLTHDRRELAARVGLHETVDQGIQRVDKETKLRRKIDSWMAVQQLFIPEVILLRERDDTEWKWVAATQPMARLRAQDTRLWLPSAIGRKAQCDTSLQQYEFELRIGQAFGALNEICDFLLIRTQEYKYKDNGLHGVKAKTRRVAEADRVAAAAAGAEDGRCPCPTIRIVWGRGEAAEKEEGEEEGRARSGGRMPYGTRSGQRTRCPCHGSGYCRRLRVQGVMRTWSTMRTDRVAALRVEWAKVRARGMSYREEVDLLEEEMRRVVQFLDWRAKWWRSRLGLRAGMQPDAALPKGHATCVHKQAAYMSGLSQRFQEQWKDVPAFLDVARTSYASIMSDEDPEEEGSDNDDKDKDEGTAGWLWD
ncbi:hypothetical protein B0H19DRAFT_1340096, partial [Mycena capillaripes]